MLAATTIGVDETEVKDELSMATVEVGRIATVVVSLVEEDGDIVGNGEEETVVRLTVIVTALGDCELLPVSPKKLLDVSQSVGFNLPPFVSDKL